MAKQIKHSLLYNRFQFLYSVSHIVYVLEMIFLRNLLVGQKTFLYVLAALIVKVCVESADAVADP